MGVRSPLIEKCKVSLTVNPIQLATRFRFIQTYNKIYYRHFRQVAGVKSSLKTDLNIPATIIHMKITLKLMVCQEPK